MRAAALVGVVADEDVAGADRLLGEAPPHVRQEGDEAAEVHRDVLGLAQRVAAPVEERGRAVAALLDVGRVAGADQRLAHLLDDRGERAADDLDGDRVDRDGFGAHEWVSRIRLR
jgi:hypothetical protein